MISKKGKLICITSTKGGVGKTALTLALASAYNHKKKKTLIIDLDLYNGSIALSLSLNPVKTIYNLVDDLSNNRYKDLNDYVLRYNDYIDVLSCPKDPRQANKIDAKYLEIILANVFYKYDVILVDMTHVLNKINIVTLDYANTILAVMTNDPMNVKSMKSFMAIMHDIEKDNVKIVLNDSVYVNKGYFSKFDIKNVLKNNIDYTISKSFNMRDFDKLILDGTIIEDIKDMGKDFTKMQKMALDLIKEGSDSDGQENLK